MLGEDQFGGSVLTQKHLWNTGTEIGGIRWADCYGSLISNLKTNPVNW
jgi:hypothetical protein